MPSNDADAVNRRRGRRPAGGAKIASDAPYGWAPLTVLCLVELVDRIEHQLLPGVLPLMQADWRFSDTAAGALPLASAAAAALIALPAGYLADRYRRTRTIAIVAFCWALATLASGLATGLAMFFCVRLVLAGSAGVYGPVSGSLLADFYPWNTRARAYGWRGVIPFLGGIGTATGGLLGQAFGWRAAFWLAAIPGVLVAGFCWRLGEPTRGLLDRSPATTGAAVPEPGERRPAGLDIAHPPPFLRQLRQILAVPTVIMIAFGQAVLFFGLAGIFYWMPSLIHRGFGMHAGVAASVSGSITVAGVLSGMLAGIWLGRRCQVRYRAGRLLVGGCGIILGGVALDAVVAVQSLAAFSVLLLFSTALMALAIPNLATCVPDVVGPSSRGVAFAVMHLLGTVGLAFGPLVVGMLSDRYESIVTATYLLTPPLLLGGALTLLARAFFERDAAGMIESIDGDAGFESR